MINSKMICIYILCFVLLAGVAPSATHAQSEEPGWPVIADVELVDNPRYARPISNTVEGLGNLILFGGRIWQLETQTYTDFVNLGRFRCPGISTGWSLDNVFLATVSPSLGLDCPREWYEEDYPDITPTLVLSELETGTITAIDLNIPDPPARESWDYLNWSPLSPNQIAIHGYYMFDVVTDQSFVFDVPETIRPINLGNYVFYQNGVWNTDTQLPVGTVQKTCCSRRLTICPFGELNDCPVFFEVVPHQMQVRVGGIASNGQWLLWVLNRFEEGSGDGSFDISLSPTISETDPCVCGTVWSDFMDSELYLTNLVSGETQRLLQLSEITDYIPEDSRGSGLFWSPDRNTVALGLVGYGQSYPGFLLITLDWGEADE